MKEARHKGHIFHIYKISRIGKSIEIKGRLAVALGWEGGGKGHDANGYGISFGGDGNVLELGSADGYTVL